MVVQLFKKLLYFHTSIKCDSLIHGLKLFYFSLRLSSLKTVNSVKINRSTVIRGNLVLPNGLSIARATNIHVPHEFEEAGKQLIEPNSMEMTVGEALKMNMGCKLVTLQGEVTAVSTL